MYTLQTQTLRPTIYGGAQCAAKQVQPKPHLLAHVRVYTYTSPTQGVEPSACPQTSQTHHTTDALCPQTSHYHIFTQCLPHPPSFIVPSHKKNPHPFTTFSFSLSLSHPSLHPQRTTSFTIASTHDPFPPLNSPPHLLPGTASG